MMWIHQGSGSSVLSLTSAGCLAGALSPIARMQLAVAELVSNEVRDMDWEKVKVLDCHPYYQRCTLCIEGWLNRVESHTMG